MCEEKKSKENATNDGDDPESDAPFSTAQFSRIASLLSEETCDGECLNRLEAESVATLIAYTAHSEEISESVVRDMVASRFYADDISKIHSRDYDSVVRYLVDFRPKEIMN